MSTSDKYLRVSFTVPLELYEESEIEELKEAIKDQISEMPLFLLSSTIYNWAKDTEVKEEHDDNDE